MVFFLTKHIGGLANGMAYDVLSIPITIFASESTFSLGSRVLTKYRSSILLENVEALFLTQNCLHGFALTCNIIISIVKLIKLFIT